jgi:hypothetical protein
MFQNCNKGLNAFYSTGTADAVNLTISCQRPTRWRSFCFRNVNTVYNLDIEKIRFTVDNGNVNWSGKLTVVGTTDN